MNLPSWLRWLQRSRYETDLDEEMEFHIEARADDLQRDSELSRDQALRQARREFGPKETAKDYCRDQDRVQWFDEFRRNLTFAARRFTKRPGLFAAIVVTLGLCIGANAVIFGVVDAVLLRQLPYPEPEQLQLVQTTFNEDKSQLGTHVDGLTWQALEDGISSLELAVYSNGSASMNFVADSPDSATPSAALVQQQRVGRNFFEVLGVPLARGRSFDRSEDLPNGPAVTVLSWQLWQDQFAGSDDVVGSAINLAGEPHVVVGIAGETFDSRSGAEVWAPLRPSTQGEGGGTNYQVIARPKPGANETQIGIELNSVAAELKAAGKNEHFGFVLTSLHEYETATLRSRLLLLWAAVALVLLIGCVNVAGLLFSTSAQRTPEIATRRALGGGIASVLRQLLTESFFLAICGGILGIGIAVAGLRWLSNFATQTLGLWQTIALDWRVLGWVGLACLVATALFGMAPALVMARQSAGDLRNRGGTRASSRTRRSLVVLQVALGLGLLLTASLLVRTLRHLDGADSGAQLDGVLSATVSLKDARFATAGAVDRYFALGTEQLEELASVDAAGAILATPFQRPLNFPFSYDGGEDIRTTAVNYVTPKTLEVLGVPLRAGRHLSERDGPDAPLVVLANEAFVKRYVTPNNSGDGEASDSQASVVDLPSVLGRFIQFGGGNSGPTREIVGVVGDLRQRPSFFDNQPLSGNVPTIYLPIGQVPDETVRLAHTWFQPSWLVRTTSSAGSAGLDIRQTLNALDPMTPAASVRSLNAVRNEALQMERFQALLLSLLAGLAVSLAVIGVAGTTASEVADRKKELGIRLALGSTVRSAIARAALPSLLLIGLGIGLGFFVAQIGVRSVSHMLYGVQPQDPTSYLTAGLGLLGAAVLACLIPALRIARFPVVSVLQDDG